MCERIPLPSQSFNVLLLTRFDLRNWPTGCVPGTQSDKKSADCKKWECSKHCKPLSDSEIVAIVTLKAAFDGSVQEARGALAECDFGCPFGHYTRLVGDSVVDLKGHPIVCYTGDSCILTILF